MLRGLNEYTRFVLRAAGYRFRHAARPKGRSGWGINRGLRRLGSLQDPGGLEQIGLGPSAPAGLDCIEAGETQDFLQMCERQSFGRVDKFLNRFSPRPPTCGGRTRPAGAVRDRELR